MNNDLQVLKNAKNFFISKINLGKVISADEIIRSLKLPDNIVTLFRHWHNSLTTCEKLANSCRYYDEIIIHDSITIQTIPESDSVDFDFTAEELQVYLEVIAIKNNIEWNTKSPVVSFTMSLKDTPIRATLVHFSLSPEKKSKAFLRRLNKLPYPLSDFSKDVTLFQKLINDKSNILICGATGSGKTSFINSLIQLIPNNEHIVILEDTYELCSRSNRSTRLITNQNTSINELLSHSLRMTPQRIIIGEVRSDEAMTFLQSMNTGHNGSMTSIHANNCVDAIHRLALLVQLHNTREIALPLITKLITKTIGYVAYIEEKRVKQLINVYGSEDDSIFYETIL